LNKYTAPKIDITSRTVETAMSDAAEELRNRNIKKLSSVVQMIFSTLIRAFSTVGKITLSKSNLVKEEPPRNSPTSSTYNKFINAVKLDLFNLFDGHNNIEKTVNDDFGYNQTMRSTISGMIKSLRSRVTDFAIVSNPVSNTEFWKKDSFTDTSGIDSKYSYAYDKLVIDAGSVTLDYDSVGGVLTPDSIDDIDDTAVSYDSGFDTALFIKQHGKIPYFGREYGVVPGGKNTVSSDERPRVEVNRNNTGARWNDKSTVNLVDPDKVDSIWEVEVTARVDVSKSGQAGPYYFLRESGISEDTINGELLPMDSLGTVVKSSMATFVYGSCVYNSDFVIDKNGNYVRRLLNASVTFKLKEPRNICSLRITRKPDSTRTVTGKAHAVYVRSIDVKTYDKATGTESGWFTLNTTRDGIRIDNSSVNDNTSTVYDENTSVYHFTATRNVKAIRINMFTDEPYKIRYSMTRWSRIVENKIFFGLFGSGKKTRYVFIQAREGRIPSISEAERMYGGNLESMVGVSTQGVTDDSDMYRWSIALSDVAITEAVYKTVGQLVSTDITVPKAADRIMLYSSYETNGGLVEYYILTPDGGTYRIQPWEDKDIMLNTGYLPKILYVNSDVPVERRVSSKWGTGAYIDTDSPLTSFRVMMILRRGNDIMTTPKVYDYKVRVVPK
jgi:hypothetical protein